MDNKHRNIQYVYDRGRSYNKSCDTCRLVLAMKSINLGGTATQMKIQLLPWNQLIWIEQAIWWKKANKPPFFDQTQSNFKYSGRLGGEEESWKIILWGRKDTKKKKISKVNIKSQLSKGFYIIRSKVKNTKNCYVKFFSSNFVYICKLVRIWE